MLLWHFWIYSFLGYLLEKLFAKATHAARQGRKCFLLLPLCPVYGLGMLAVLALPVNGLRLVLWGGFAATAVEYGVHWAYDRLLHVRFWDYSCVPGNLHGRVCLPFAAAWGILTALAVRWVQPGVMWFAERTVPEVTGLCLLVFVLDGALSVRRLLDTGDGESLRADRWRNREAKGYE